MSESTHSQERFLVRTFYRFCDLPQAKLPQLKEQLLELGERYQIRGSLLISTEGINATIAGLPERVDGFFRELQSHFPGLTGQDSFCDKPPFKRWKVPIKKQIVQASDPEMRPSGNHSKQTSPREWDKIRELVRQGQAQMVDVRNSYEVGIGSFPEAIDPGTNTFKEFTDFLDRETGKSLDPALPTAIFCTGGIRCEKARIDFEKHGFENVLQLEGGILGYFKNSAEQGFDGECFVFDDRVAVDSELQPSSSYQLCPKCGGPAPRDGGPHNCDNGRRPSEGR